MSEIAEPQVPAPEPHNIDPALLDPPPNFNSPSPPSNPAQPDERSKIGDIIEIIHTVGNFLRLDKDHQSLARMSAACKAYKADLASWVEKGKGYFRQTDKWEVVHLTEAQLRLVKKVSGGILRAYDNNQIYLCFKNDSRDPRFTSLEQMDNVSLRCPASANFKQPTLASVPTANIRSMSLESSGGVSKLSHCDDAFFANLKTLCPPLERLRYMVTLDEPIDLDHDIGVDGCAWKEASWMLRADQAGIDNLSHTLLADDRMWAITCGVVFAPALDAPLEETGQSSGSAYGSSVDWHVGMSVKAVDLTPDKIHAFGVGFAWFLRSIRGRVIRVRFGAVCGWPMASCNILVTRLHAALHWLGQVAYMIAQNALGEAEDPAAPLEPLEHPVELCVTMSYPLSKDKDRILYSVRETFSTEPDVEGWDAWRDAAGLERLKNGGGSK